MLVRVHVITEVCPNQKGQFKRINVKKSSCQNESFTAITTKPSCAMAGKGFYPPVDRCWPFADVEVEDGIDLVSSGLLSGRDLH